MNRRTCLKILGHATPALLLAADAPTATPPKDAELADFKLVVHLYGVAKAPITTAELVVRRGVIYQFLTDIPEEVLIIVPSQARVLILDLERKVQTELSSKRLDRELARLHAELTAAVALKEKSGKRADAVAAEVTRGLIDPKYRETYDPASLKLRLDNPSVEVTASLAPEPDRWRRDTIANALVAIAKIGVLRDPRNLPPFTRIDALRAVTEKGEFRPTEITYLYRLTGPPRKLRWTFEVVDTLTDREREAITRVIQMSRATAIVPYERYERPPDPEP